MHYGKPLLSFKIIKKIIGWYRKLKIIMWDKKEGKQINKIITCGSEEVYLSTDKKGFCYIK